MSTFRIILHLKLKLTLLSDQAVASVSHAQAEDGMLQFDEGDIILVLSNDTQEVGLFTFLTFCVSLGRIRDESLVS